MAFLFLLAAAAQYNDPDPVQWTVIYLLPAIACVQSVRGKLNWVFPAAVCIVSLGWAAVLAPSALSKPVELKDLTGSFEMMNLAVEEAREMIGLLIVATWMCVLTIVEVRRGKSAIREPTE